MATASEFRRDLRDRLPLPLARLYTRTFNAKSVLERHHVAVSLLEATVRFGAAAQIAAYAASGRRESKLAPRLENLALPSLGHWVELLRETARTTAGYDPHPFAELAGAFGALAEERDDLPATRAALVEMGRRVEGVPEFGRQRVRPIDLLDRLPAYRNQAAAHAGVRRDDAFYAEMGRLLVAATEEFLEKVPLLGKTVLVYVSEVRQTPSGRVVDLWNLTGSEALSDTAPPGARDAAGTGLLPGRLYLQRGDLFLDLHPQLVCDPAPPEAGVAFVNRSQVERKRIEYVDFVAGAVAAAPQLLDDHRRFLSRLLGRDLSPSDVVALQEKSVAESPDPAAEPTSPASRLFGDFELLGRLGEGGMGVVYLARQRSLGRVVALKMLPPSAGADDISVARFQREIRALARADHAHVVRILSSGRTEGTWWYAMEHVDGGDLREASRSLGEGVSRSTLSGGDLARAVSSVSERRRSEVPAAFAEVPDAPKAPAPDLGAGMSFFARVAEIGHDAARGLQHLHERGIVHRDVKPGNVMVTRDDGRAVIMDLGLARLTGDASVTQATAVLGSIPYAAPEQIQEALLRRKVDARADVYGLGATLYDLVTGRPPYRGDDGPSLVAQVLREAPIPPRKVDRSIPGDLEAIVLKAMDRDPERRYPSAAALAEDLDRFARGEPVSARPPSLIRLTRQWVRRHAVLSSTLAVALASVVVGTLLYVRGVEAEQRRTEDALGRTRILGLVAESANAERGDSTVSFLLAREAVRRSAGKDVRAVRRLREALPAPRETALCVGHQDTVVSAEFSPSGDRILTASHDNTARLWTLAGKEVAVLRGHNDDVLSATFSPQGDRILTASRDNTARLWTPEGKQVAVLRHEAQVTSAVFSPQGDRILTASLDSTARLWTLEGKEVAVLRGHKGLVESAVFSPRGDRMLTASWDKTARLWTPEGKEVAVVRGHDATLNRAVFSPQGDRILTSSLDKTARLWTLRGEAVVVFRGHEGEVSDAVFSPQGDRILTASLDKTARLWNLDGKEVAVLRGHEEWVQSAVFSPQGDRILTASGDKTARLWTLEGEEVVVFRGHEGEVSDAVFSPQGDRILTRSVDNTARLWTPEGKAVLRRHEGTVTSAVFSPRGDQILTASGDNTVRLWTLEGKEVAVLRGHESAVTSAIFSPLGDRILTASYDETARFWTLEGKQVAVFRHEAQVTSAVFSPSGDWILTASYDKTARLWTLEGKEVAVLRGHKGIVESAVFSPQGDRILTASWDKTARLWTPEGKEVAIIRGHEGQVSGAVFSAQGDRILTASGDKTARLWTLEGEEVAVFRGHEGPVLTAALSPQGDRILTACSDNRVRLWTLEGKEVAVLRGHGNNVVSAVFSPQGDRILTASWDKTARLWTPEGKEVAIIRGHGRPVTSAVFSPQGDRILTASWDKTARLWWVRGDDLLRIANETPVRDFTPEERERYRDLLGD